MPIAILKFRLPEETSEFVDAQEGVTSKIVLHELDQFLRKTTKYEDDQPEKQKYYQEVREELWRLTKEYNLTQE